MQRFFEIDSARGIAVTAMIAFHALFDLNYFAGYSFAINQGVLLALGMFAAVAFVFLAGLSLTLSYNKAKAFFPLEKSLGKKGLTAKALLNKKRLLKKFLGRGTKIFLLGMLITAFTWLIFPQSAIWFGVLHCIGISIILAFPFLQRKKASLAAGALLVIAGLFIAEFSFPFPWLLWLGLKPLGFTSFDYFPLLPWFGVFLLGISAGNLLYPEGKRKFAIKDFSQSAVISFLCFLGRNSLAIYFLHQPVLVAAIMLLG